MSHPHRPHRSIAERVHELRRGRFTATELAERMASIGFKWDRFTVQNFENGRRATLTVEEFLGLAYVLDVAPLHLLIPTGDHYFQPVPQPLPGGEHANDAVIEARAAREWVSGKTPLPGTDLRLYFSQVPEDEFRERFGHGSQWKPSESEVE